jgi:hypothetical protein
MDDVAAEANAAAFDRLARAAQDGYVLGDCTTSLAAAHVNKVR